MAQGVKCPFLVEARALQSQCHAALLMRPIPPCSVAAPQERFVRSSIFTDEVELLLRDLAAEGVTADCTALLVSEDDNFQRMTDVEFVLDRKSTRLNSSH